MLLLILGGNLGSTRLGGADLNQKHSGRDPIAAVQAMIPSTEEPRKRPSTGLSSVSSHEDSNRKYYK